MADMSAQNDQVPENPNRRLRERGVSQADSKAEVTTASNEKLQNERSNAQKTWFEEYIYSKDWPILGTIGKWLTAKPVAGVVTGLTGSTWLGEASRVLVMGAALYYGTPYIFNLFASGEGAASGPGLDWLWRLFQGRGKLASATGGTPPPPGIPGGTMPYETL